MTCTRARDIDLAAFALDRGAAEFAEFRAHYARCADCSREVARLAKLGAALASVRPVASGHPTEAQLQTFAVSRETLAAAESERVALHVAGCAACRTELAVLQRFDLAALAEAKPESLTARVRTLLAGLRDALRPPRLVRSFALAAAAVAALTLSVWLLRDRAGVPRGEPSQPLAGAPPSPGADPIASEANAADAPRTPSQESSPPPRVAEAVPNGKAKSVDRAPVIEPSPAPSPVPPIPRIASLIPTEAPRYRSGAESEGPLLRIGSIGRGPGDTAPRPQALAPSHLGFTAQESPTLYWFLPEATPLGASFTIGSEASAAPLLETTLAGPVAAGIHSVSLAEHGARLSPGTDYQWFVAVIADPERRSRDVVSGAAIRYVPPSAELARKLAHAEAGLAHAYAEAGLWYDAFDQLSRWVASEPDAALLRSHRAALLEQVGLPEIAAVVRPAP